MLNHSIRDYFIFECGYFSTGWLDLFEEDYSTHKTFLQQEAFKSYIE